MSQQHPVVNYIGERERAQNLENQVQPKGWALFHSADVLEALGQYIFYMPDIVVIDAETDTETAEDAYMHLRSVDAHPLIILSDAPQQWDTAHDPLIRVLDTNSTLETIVDTILELVEAGHYHGLHAAS